MHSKNNVGSDKGTLTWHKNRIYSFAHLEASEEILPVEETIIKMAELVLIRNWEATQLVPFMTVPTRSAGIALDYRIGTQEVYYRFLDDESFSVTYRLNKKTQKTFSYSNISEAPLVKDLIC